MTTPNPDFISSLVAQGSGSSSQSFATGSPGGRNAPDPARQGFSRNVAGGTVNLATSQGSVDTELLGLHRPSRGGTQTNVDATTVDQAALALFGMSKGPNGQVAALQQRLHQAGYLNKINTPGIPDDDTAKAYGSLLQQVSASNMAGDPVTVNEYLQKSAEAAAAAGLVNGKAPRVGSVFHTTNPLDINQTAQQVAQQELGRKLNPKQLAQFVAVYHGIEAHKNAQVAGSDATTSAGGDVSIQDAPSVGAAADNFVQSHFAGEAGAASVANTFSTFRKLIS